MTFIYDIDLYDESTINSISYDYINILKSISFDKEMYINDIKLEGTQDDSNKKSNLDILECNFSLKGNK